MNSKKKIILHGLILILMSSIATANIVKEEEWSGLFGSLGSLGFYFSTIVNYIIYGWFFVAYWFLVTLFFVLIGLILFWLPLKLYPTFIQYNNFFKRIFGIS